MGKNSGFKRVLSVLLSLVLLLSSMAVAGVSAAGGAEFHYTFDDSVDSYTASGGYAGYYSTGGHNVKYKPGIGIETEHKNGGYSTSGYAMRMAYTGNGTTADAMAHASFSLPNNTGVSGYGSGLGKTLKLPAGSAYQITVTYKVTGYQSAASLYFAIGLGALGIDNNPAWSSKQSVKLNRDITATTADWVTASAVITPTTQDGAYIVLKMADDTNRAGTEVLIGAIDVEPVVETIPPEEGAWSFEGESEGTTLDLNSSSTETITVTAEGRYSGERGVRVDSRTSGGDLRPQMMVKDADGNQVMVEAGKDYRITFWAMVPQGTGGFGSGLNFWFTAATDTNCYNTSNYKKTAYVIAEQIAPQTQGQWQKITVDVEDCALSGMLRLGICADSRNNTTVHFYLDDIKVETVQSVPAMEGAWSFETEAENTQLCLGSSSSRSITVTKEEKHTGKQSVRVNATDSSGNGRPQMNVKDADGNLVQVEAGKDYRITFWAKVPVGGHDYPYSVWFTAVPEDKKDTAHSSSFNKSDLLIGSELTQSQSVAKGEWQQITYEIDNSAFGGYLRLGIAASGANNNATVLYLDDIKVEEVVIEITPPEEGVWSFETEAENTQLCLGNSSSRSITVTKEEKHAGEKSVRVNAKDSSGNGRPQMNVKDADGNLVQVEAGKDYRITFWAKVPEGGHDYPYSVWFTAVPEDKKDTAHSSSFNKSDLLIGTELTQPQSVAKGEWQQITYEIDNSAFGGYLRLGIAASGANNNEAVLYLDDIKVEEIVIEILPPEEGAWSFETEAEDTQLCLGSSSSRSIAVTKAAKHAGEKSVCVTASDSSGNGRPQMNIKDADGNLIQVEAGENYRITFWAMVPQGGHDYPYNVWFTAVPEDKKDAVHDGNFNKNSYVIGTEQEVAQTAEKGEWQQITYDIEDCSYSGYLRIGIAGHGAGRNAIMFYLDDIKISPLQVDYTEPEEGAWSFETETNGETLDVNATSTEIVTVTTEAKHTGKKAVRVNASNSSGNDRPQMMVKDDKGELIQVEAGKGYRISFWVMVPEGGHDKDHSIWFTAVNEDNKDVVHSSSFNKNDYLIDSELTIPQAVAKGEWQLITRDVEESAYSGYLRIGIAAAGANRTAVKFYIDDIKVTPIVLGEYEPLDFENYEIGTELDMNADPNRTIIVTDKYACTGTKSAQVNSNNSGGDDRPQMLVKDGNGRQFKVKKGRNYEVTFSVFIPESEVNYSVNYWLAATTDEVCFSRGGQRKNDYVVAEKSSTDQLTKGVWNSVTLTITDCKYSGKLRLGITGSISRKPNDPHTFYIDDLTVVETIIDGDRYTMSFEPYELGTKLSMNTNGASITVSDIERRAGYQSAQFVTLGSDLNEAPQMTVNTFQIEPVKVEAGKRYRVSFWMLVPVGEPDYDIQFWLAATNNNNAFTTASKRNNLVCDTQTVEIDEKGVWKQVLLTIDKCAYTGTLRLGAAGTTDVPHTFYLDDIKVEERNSTPVDPEAMNFENLTVGENISIANDQNLTAVVTDMDSYTGNQSVYISSNANTGDARPQFNAVDGNGELMKLEKGKDYFITFAVMVPTTESYFTFSYWAAVVPEDKLDKPFKRNSDFIKNDYVIAEISGGDQPLAGEWHELKLAVTNCKYDGYLRMGFTHHNAPPFTSHFYIDDIKVNDPDYVTVKFETNGAENAEDYSAITIMSGTLVPTQEYVDPYRFGYEFMGWYSDPNFTSESYVDLYATPIVGKNGEVVTLYALWEKWTEVQAGEREESEDKFKVEYTTEKVWIGDQNVADPLTAGDAPSVNDAAPIVVEPDEAPQSQDPAENAMPPWLIVVIIVAAVIVTGGGATIAAIMLKKNKKA